MTPEQYQLVADVFERALQREAAARAAFVHEAAGGDEVVIERVGAMLRAHAESELNLDAPAVDLEALRAHAQESSAPTPRHVAHFEIIELLGAGGMGVVYRARRSNPDREVALKMLRDTVVTESMRRRFELEAQILAKLNHPGIAQIFEAGTAEVDGAERPWFAMELIEGEPLIDYASRAQLGTRARIELARRVCRAVESAHRQGVVHRDLKPGNVLVTPDGHPKVLDFGIARATDSDLAVTTRHTDLGELLGTIPYMSPEQVAGTSREIDARSDVYALGVVIYELLTGRLPYQVRDASIAEAVRVINETEPAPMSSINRTLRGDLDTIVGKALEKDPARRYLGADQLADDLDRYLADEPILARPASAMYQLRKFARRHRSLVVSAAVVVTTLVAAAIISALFAIAATRDRDAAEQALGVTEATNEFLHEILLEQAAPDAVPDLDLTLYEAMNRAAAQIDDRFDDQPVARGLLHRSMGEMYWGYGEYETALSHLVPAKTVLSAELGADHSDTILARRLELSVLYQLGRYREALDLGPDVIEAHRRTLGPKHAETTMTINEVAVNATALREYETAIPLMRQVLAGHQAEFGDEHQYTVGARINLADALARNGQDDDAVRLLGEAIDFGTKGLGADAANVIIAKLNLSLLLRKQDRLDEALPLATGATAGAVETFGPEHPLTMNMKTVIGRIERDLGNGERALEIHHEVLATREATSGPDARSTLSTWNDIGLDLSKLGRTDEAVTTYEQALARLDNPEPPLPLELGIYRNIAKAFIAAERWAEAEARYLETWRLVTGELGAESTAAWGVADDLVEFYEERERDEDVAVWRERAGAAR